MGTDSAVLDPVRVRPRQTPVQGHSLFCGDVSPVVKFVRGRADVAKMRGMLVELSTQSGQRGAMDGLDFYLNTPSALKKIPCLALVGLRGGVAPEDADADDVQGAVLLHEYQVGGWGTKVFATDDITGRRTVIAPAEIRSEVAEAACRVLLECGALLVLLSHEGDDPLNLTRPAAKTSGPRYTMTARRRFVPRHLPLAETMDETLATMGRHTRRNLRRYRRRLEADFGARFVESVDIGLRDFLEMNQESMHPVADELAMWRYERFTCMPEMNCAGILAKDGRWLSLVGRLRCQGTTEIVWQMNRAGMPRYSLSTAMRFYLLQHEISLGVRKLEFEGGTPHSMRHSFVFAPVLDKIVLRRSLRGWLLRKFAGRFLPENNVIRDALQDKELKWARS